MSDPLEEAYSKYLTPDTPTPGRDLENEIMSRRSEAPCPECASKNVDRKRGYRGEYKCLDCGHAWQVGGRDSRD
jgi:transposase-like protein